MGARDSKDSPADYDAIIVGAGVAGLYQLHRLREMGLDVRSIDAASDVGGTWYWNCYPGARVDSQSYVYQYWFSEELIRDWNWSQRFPPQPELERYLDFVAERLDLRKDIQFDTRVTSADWDEASRRWIVRTDQGDELTTRFLVSCTGMLSAPNVPPFPGHEDYRGIVAHTARYPREGIDLAGKRVAPVPTTPTQKSGCCVSLVRLGLLVATTGSISAWTNSKDAVRCSPAATARCPRRPGSRGACPARQGRTAPPAGPRRPGPPRPAATPPAGRPPRT